MQVKRYLYVTAGVALVGASVIAATPTTAPLSDVHLPDIQLTAGGDATDIVIDIVRHGQRLLPDGIPRSVESPPYPGLPLSDLGQQQAHHVGNQLFNDLGGPNGVAGVFSGQGIRDMDTAAPFAALEHMTPQILPGLDEVDPGIYAEVPQLSLGGILHALTVIAWASGAVLVPMPGSEDANGVVFDEKFTDAVDTMYKAAMDNPVVSANDHITDVAFNNEASIADWALMNVKNPDLSFFLSLVGGQLTNPKEHPLLPNAGIVQIEGNPTDGWTLVSWDGHAIPAHPGFLTELFVDFRNLITAPQTALWNMFEAALHAALHGDPTTAMVSALQVYMQNVGAAFVQFPESVINDIVAAMSNLGADTGGQAAGETGVAAGDAFASLF